MLLSTSAAFALQSSPALADVEADSELAADAAADAADTTIVVTGNRAGSARTVATSPVPIDVISGQQVRDGGKPALLDALAQTLPSFNAPAVQATGRAVALMRSGSLRGLGPDRTLFLVNGRRRHASSSFNPDGYSIGSPVDLDFIPTSAIERVEVLRSAASAQYGSDAIGGVINIILRSESEGFRATTQLGQNYEGDGELYQQELNYGSSLGGSDGFINLAFVAKYRGVADRSDDVVGTIYNPLPDGSPDPREATAERHRYRHNGAVPAAIYVGSFNAEVPLGDNVDLYSFATVGYRDGWSKYIPRLPKDIVSLPEIYPEGFYPRVDVKEWDIEAVTGLKGVLSGWNWDASLSYARNSATYVARETLNPSLGPASPTSFLAQKSRYTQFIGTLDVSRSFDIGLGGPLEVAFGGDVRHETYTLIAGDPLNEVDGGYVIPSGFYAGRQPPAFVQGVQFASAADAGSKSRNVYSVYVDLGLNPTDKFYLGFAGRFQHYDDFSGSTANAKVSTRYEILPGFAVRASAGTGFRAPSLQKLTFQQTNAAIQVLLGVERPVLARYVTPDNPIAIALGAVPLKPEKSKDFSVGATLEPVRGLTVTGDYYQIWLDDRITTVSPLTGTAVNNILGLPADYSGPANRIQYFANAMDTKTKGFDIVGTYALDLASAGSLRLTAAYNYNKARILDIRETPPALAALGSSYIYFNRQSQGFVINTPRDKVVFGADWTWGGLNVNTRVSRYGRYVEYGSALNGSQDFSYPARWITDLSVSYHVSERVRLSVGANNLFDVYPRKKPRAQNPNSTGFGAYGAASPFGMTGGFYYTRLDLNF
ncbi:TonB-dependent receptor [Tsuneonella sp. CC-YZS046]|uniref:TonB-dependent receptor plug domain-containing protein n=1 Tax=Tsuneonella sp. CC-YZS046 TaxID=3042152 RepID=UPI002D7657AA|nr:TonB-dependent receptor [Tsuneonella sp. CC-YZS046]WRO67791.1 TonB-dependent receptor [Tsuneonella sp. CC-YZS046]